MLFLENRNDDHVRSAELDSEGSEEGLEVYLVGLMIDAINQWIGSHSYIQVGVAQPLNSFFNVSNSSQSHLGEGKTKRKKCFAECSYVLADILTVT